jgi:hypothetical protein
MTTPKPVYDIIARISQEPSEILTAALMVATRVIVTQKMGLNPFSESDVEQLGDKEFTLAAELAEQLVKDILAISCGESGLVEKFPEDGQPK